MSRRNEMPEKSVLRTYEKQQATDRSALALIPSMGIAAAFLTVWPPDEPKKTKPSRRAKPLPLFRDL